jgi:dUTP pyrophosphatase
MPRKNNGVSKVVTVSLTLEPGSVGPAYQTKGSAGVDLCSNETFELAPLERRVIGTGMRVAIPFGYEGQVRPRSGLAARHGLGMVNSPGTIDSDYRGEIRLILINLGEEGLRIERGERVAQLVICPVVQADFDIVEQLDGTSRGDGGFGSTGR